MRKILLKFVKWSAFLSVVAIGYFVFDNNCCDSEIDYSEVQAANTRAVDWIMENRNSVLGDENPMLWWWLKRAASISKDARLSELYQEYKAAYLRKHPRTPWEYLLTGRSSHSMMKFNLEALPDYNLFFFYGMSCDEDLGSFDIVRQQMSPEFCLSTHPFSPACVTHQAMGFRFMQKTNCGDSDHIDDSLETLLGYARYQAILDFRVTDVYMQRVFTLVEAGRLSDVNPRWIKKILNAQFDDGGWADFQPLIPVGGDRYFGYKSKGVKISKKEGWFHTVAQGLLLTTLLLEQQN